MGMMLIGVAGVMLLGVSEGRGATFTAFTNDCQAGAATVVRIDQPASTANNNFVCAFAGFPTGFGNVAARADSGGIGVGVEYQSYGGLSIAQARGQIDTTFTVNGPAGAPIPIAINFELTGFLGGGTSAQEFSRRQIENRITAITPGAGNGFAQFYGQATEVWNATLGLSLTTSGALAIGGDCFTPCRFQTAVFYVAPGAVNNLTLWAQATVDSGNGVGYGEAKFLNTFHFATDRDVFVLPEGYSVTVAGMDLVNNRVPGGEIPEPGTWGLMLGSFAVIAYGRRR